MEEHGSDTGIIDDAASQSVYTVHVKEQQWSDLRVN
jgi:hypothetical protein